VPSGSDSFWPARRVLLTGGGGFLGSFVRERLAREHPAALLAPRKSELDLRDGAGDQPGHDHDDKRGDQQRRVLVRRREPEAAREVLEYERRTLVAQEWIADALALRQRGIAVGDDEPRLELRAACEDGSIRRDDL
jgi:nucleoside-diphosphate-sugar epimerase